MNSFFKKLIITLSSVGFYQIVNLLSLPILTKTYDSSSFGSFYFCTSVSSVIYVFFNFKTDWCIPTIKDEELTGFLSFILVHSFVTFSILTCFSYWFGGKYFFTIILALLLAIDETFFIYNNRKNQYSLSAILHILQCLLFVVMALFVFKNKVNGLIISYILSYLATSIYNILRFGFDGFKQINLRNIFGSMPGQIRIMFGCFFQKFRLHMPSIFIPFCFDITFAGIWGILTRVTNVPTAMFANKVSDVVFQEFGICVRKKQSTQKLFKKIFFVIFLISLFMFFSMFFLNDVMCDLLFSSKWNVNPSYMRCLLLGAWAYFLYSCFKQVLIIYGMTKYYFYWHLLFSITTVIVFLLQYFLNYNFQTFLKIVSYSQSLFFLWNLYTVKEVVYSKKAVQIKP